jgi:uncharacterized protein (TIGR03086 family)
MADMVDLAPAANELAALLGRIDDDQLSAPTPCDIPLAALLDHVGGLAQAFAAAAAKSLGPMTSTPPAPDASRLDVDWRKTFPRHLDALAEAWHDPAAWQGMTQVGGVTLPGEVAGQIALNEVVLHGWDVARASGQPFDVEPTTLEASMRAITTLFPVEHPERRQGVYGPVVDVPADATPVDRLVAFSGRDPGWTAPR